MNSVYIHDLFKVYQDACKTIRANHEKGVEGLATARLLTRHTDEFISNLFDLLDPDFRQPVAILALGGYGRRELCPHSDIDVLILYRDESTKKAAEYSSMAFLHLLYDVGFNVGHAFRSFNECFELRGDDFDSWAAILEARYLCGNAAVYDEFAEHLNETQRRTKSFAFIHHVLEGQLRRHLKYGRSVKLLEPNVKQSAGGLRDIHSLVWMFRSLKEYPLPMHNESHIRYTSLSVELVQEFRELNRIDSIQCERLLKALDYILRVRHALHYSAGNVHDSLDFGLQQQIAQELGYRDTISKRAAEYFMREYYIHTREISRFNELLTQMYRDLYRPPLASLDRSVRADDLYTYDGNTIGITDELPARFQMSAQNLLHAFVHQAKYGAPFDNRVRATLLENASLIDGAVRRSQQTGRTISAILNDPYPATALRSMHELGILERIIPEFGDLVAFFQHNQYHYYTADEHTIIAAEKLQDLARDDSVLGEVYRGMEDREPLYFAALFHDIAKPRRVIDHEIIGADMAEEILTRLHRTDRLEDIQFLIRHHLMMEQVAFRRNIYEHETIDEFASRFSSQAQLDILYLLTYADLSAVNPKVWTDWKSQLLQELYLRTSDIVARNIDDVQKLQRYRSSMNRIIEKISSHHSEDSIREHIDQFDDRNYIASFSDKEITQHIETIERKQRSGETVTMHFTHHRAFTELTIITKDRPYALSDFCGVLTVCDANIIDANIFTRADGIIIDKFRVVDFINNSALSDEKCNTIKQLLDDLASQRLTNVGELVERQRRKWKRRHAKQPKAQQSIRVKFDSTPHHTIIDVYGPDVVGLLYTVTRTLSELGLNIYFAKIASRVDGIVDSFYVLTEAGERIPQHRYPELREAIELALEPVVNTK
jgi:[protein-PII] uridylyltransferase